MVQKESIKGLPFKGFNDDISTLLLLLIHPCPFLLKEQCHKMDIYLEGPNIIVNTFFVCADSFMFFESFFLTHTIITFLFASLKLLTNFENAY